MAKTRLAFSMAGDVFACSQYTNYNFNSIAVGPGPNGKVLGFNEDGIFVLDDADGDEYSGGTEPIVASVRFARSMLNSFTRKKVRAISVSGEFLGNLTATITGDEVRTPAGLLLAPTNTESKQTMAFKTVPRTAYGVYLDLELENHLGADFSIDAIDLFIVPMPHLG